MEVSERPKSLVSVSSKKVLKFELALHKTEEKTDILFLKARDVVCTVDNPVQDTTLSYEPNHSTKFCPILQVVVELKFAAYLTERRHLKKEIIYGRLA